MPILDDLKIPTKERKIDAAGAPEHGIEITPEMIEAGADVLFCYDEDSRLSSNVIRRVYLAMVAAKLIPHSIRE